MPTEIPVTSESGTKYVEVRSRSSGATFRQFLQFRAACHKGVRVELHGVDFVAMSRDLYDELIARNKPTVVRDESRHEVRV